MAGKRGRKKAADTRVIAHRPDPIDESDLDDMKKVLREDLCIVMGLGDCIGSDQEFVEDLAMDGSKFESFAERVVARLPKRFRGQTTEEVVRTLREARSIDGFVEMAARSAVRARTA